MVGTVTQTVQADYEYDLSICLETHSVRGLQKAALRLINLKLEVEDKNQGFG